MWWDLLPPEFNPGPPPKGEIFWSLHQAFLAESGYKLRPKYEPGWQPPPWKTEFEMIFSAEYDTYKKRSIMDATRASDGRLLTLKSVSKSVHPHEAPIGRFLSSPPLASDPKNHCVPIFDVLQSPLDDDVQIIVMPRLYDFNDTPFDTVGELLDCFRQIFEGVEFMHKHFVAHRQVYLAFVLDMHDCTLLNIVLDPDKMYPEGFNPVSPNLAPNRSDLKPVKYITRTKCWPRYYIIDFGISRRYDPSNGPPMEPPISGGDKHAPEHSIITVNPPWVDDCNPFPTDMYYLGSLLKRTFFDTFPPLQFLSPLTDDMIQWDPNMRPTIGEVIQRFAVLCNQRTTWQLRLPGCPERATFRQKLRQLKYFLLRIPPLPSTPFATDTTIDNPSLRPFYTLTPARLAAHKSLGLL
ncbi:hypothetical protein IW261DRAFT_1341496 [Armillaria novae-zelandiae]|uniref:Protein kinase domain-containing protein n=1 Tax=Armillaria novae-zelandiae TaxID=153914 RepID=A0AA39UDC3_9AGAR|nr:hypothetical protein IW261DRAFT_1341496 [Armillaria novae-zelandiae]